MGKLRENNKSITPLGDNNNFMELQDSLELEDNISVFYVQDIDEACRSGNGGGDFGPENGDLTEKIIYWETQEALLQVCNSLFIFLPFLRFNEEIIIIIFYCLIRF